MKVNPQAFFNFCAAHVPLMRQLAERTGELSAPEVNVTIKLPSHTAPLVGLDSVEVAREHLEDHRQAIQRWQAILAAIEQRESLQRQLKSKREQRDGRKDPSGAEIQEGLAKRIWRFQEYQKAKVSEPRLRADLKAVTTSATAVEERITTLEKQRHATERAEQNAKAAILKEENEFKQVIGRFGDCIFPEFPAKARIVEDIPDDFDASNRPDPPHGPCRLCRSQASAPAPRAKRGRRKQADLQGLEE